VFFTPSNPPDYVRAADAALASYANKEAEMHFRQALDLTCPEDEQAQLLSGLGEALYRQTRFDEAVDLVRRQGRASISMLQRRLRIGYTRSARLIETMEEKGIVSPPQPGAQTRDVLDYGPAAPPVGDD